MSPVLDVHVNSTSSEPPEPPEPPNRLAQGQLRIRGQALEGSTLTADHSGITDADGKPTAAADYSYIWKYTNQGAAVSTEASIRLDSPRLGERLQACVTFNDNRDGAEGPFCAETGAILNAPNGTWDEPSIRAASSGQVFEDNLASVGNLLFAESDLIRDPDGFKSVERPREPRGPRGPRGFAFQWVHVPASGTSTLIPNATMQVYELRRLAKITWGLLEIGAILESRGKCSHTGDTGEVRRAGCIAQREDTTALGCGGGTGARARWNRAGGRGDGTVENHDRRRLAGTRRKAGRRGRFGPVAQSGRRPQVAAGS